MQSSTLELSPQVRLGRYANFSALPEAGGRIFMAGYEECAPDYEIERTDFPFWMLEFVAGGYGEFFYGKQGEELRHGSVFVYGPGVRIRFRNEAERPFRKYFLVSTQAGCPRVWQDIGLQAGRVFQLKDAASLITIFDQIIDEGEKLDAQTGQVVSGLHNVALALIARFQAPTRGERSGSRQAYDVAMAILQRDYRSLQTLADLAHRTGYSGEYLCRVFKKYHGASPYQVLLHRKMSAAWLLLRDGNLQVRAVAQELGYEDPLHFSRVFKKVMGCPPSSV
ncbi:MAG: AraC family transcriptional regulator [Coraliomargarita sp.]